jgi:hypothetical protein
MGALRRCALGAERRKTSCVCAAGRSSATWQLQGQEPPNLSKVRGSLARLKRLACWFLGQYAPAMPREQMGAVLVRLRMLALYADFLTRCAAVSALCKTAVLSDSLDVMVAIYEFLHSLEVAEFDLSICPDVKVRFNRSDAGEL